MARSREKLVDLYAPDGTPVQVTEKRAEVLKGRQYTTSKPRKQTAAAGGRKAADDSAEVQRLREELAAATERAEEAEKLAAEATAPPADAEKK